MKKVSIGFTGTSGNVAINQWLVLKIVLKIVFEKFRDSGVQSGGFHHGDCVGADAMAHKEALHYGHEITIHPSINEYKRAFCEGAKIILPARDYIDRNHDIVDACDVLFACPGTMEEQLRSGTWATIRYARKQGKKLIIVYPDGSKFT
jgi:hypothetical protein